MAYGKLFESLFTGSMVGAGPTVFAVWTYVIAHAKPPGSVEINPKILATILGCCEADVLRAVETLCAEDPASRSPEEGGRRLIQEGPFLYRVPTWSKYNAIRNEIERREQNREAQRRRRASLVGVTDADRQHPSAKSAHADVDADADSEVPPVRPPVRSRTVPVPSAPPQEAGGRAGGEPPVAMSHEPEDDMSPDIAPGSPGELNLLLECWGWGTRLPDRLGLCRELIAQGLDLEQLGDVGRLARQQGKDPAALGMTWLQAGTWRDVLADAGMHTKEASVKARAPASDVDVPGPIYGEDPKPIKALRP